MVAVVAATTAAVAACPPLVAAAGAVGGTASTVAEIIIGVAGSSQGIAAGTATTVALGEGAVVGLGVLGSGGSSSAGIALATMVGPIGWFIVGCSKNEDHSGSSSYTWDCWKPIIRDTTAQPSSGLTLRCLAAHPKVQSMALDEAGIVVRNIFGERFRLTPVNIEGIMAFHASIIGM